METIVLIEDNVRIQGKSLYETKDLLFYFTIHLIFNQKAERAQSKLKKSSCETVIDSNKYMFGPGPHIWQSS